jgi:hypothetical protein
MNGKIVFGIVIMISSIWGSAYLAHLVASTWAEKPTVFTMGVMFFYGFFVAAGEILDLADKDKRR